MKKMKIKEFAEVISGSTPKTNVPEYWNGDYCWITPAEICSERKYIYDTERKITIKGIESSNLKELKEGTVLLTSRAPIGKVAISKINIYCNQGFKAIVCNRELAFPDYIYYWLCANNQYLNSLGRGATFKEISKKIVEDIEVPLPDLNKQVEIANILDQAQELIDKRKAQIEALDELIQSLFYDMFGDPFNKADSNLRSLNEFILLNPKKSEVKDLDLNFEVSFVPMECVGERGELNLSHTRILADVYKGFTYFKNNDVLFAKITPCMENGKGTVAKNLINGIGFGSTEFHVLRPIKDISNPIWLYHLTRLDSFRKLAENQMTGSAGQKRVPTTFFTSLKVIVPSIELQNQFAEIVENIEKQKELLNESLVELENNFNSLMQRAFSGGSLR